MMARDTIFALASGAGRAAVAVVRLSGPHCGEVLRGLRGACHRPGERCSRAFGIRRRVPSWIEASCCGSRVLPRSRARIAPNFTCMAAGPWLRRCWTALGAVPGCRLAEPGEFTRRAFLNGKLDLAAVEGLADLIDAETEAQRRQALAQLGGVLGRWVEDLRGRPSRRPGAGGIRHRFRRRRRCRRAMRSPGPLDRAAAVAAGDPRGTRQAANRRAHPGRRHHHHRGAAERRQIHPAQRAWRGARPPSCRRTPAPPVIRSRSAWTSAGSR